MNTLSLDTKSAPGLHPWIGHWIGRGALGLLVLSVIAGIWFASTQQETKRRAQQEISTLIPFEPPPEQKVEPQPQDKVVQTETPSQASEAAADSGDNAASMDAEAQAGTGGVQVGDGSGSRGAGRAGRGSYASYLAGAIQRAVQADRELRNRTMRVPISLWVDASGRIIRVELRERGSPYEAALRAAILAASDLRTPPAGIIEDLPLNMTVDLRPPA